MFCYIIINEANKCLEVSFMKTSSKYRRIMRQRKLRRQRSVAFMVVLILTIAVASVAFANYSQSKTEKSVEAVVVCPGDTVWSLAKEYKPEGANLNEFVYEISANNGIKDGNIICGQTLYIPVES